eukprot:gene5323-6468_t
MQEVILTPREEAFPEDDTELGKLAHIRQRMEQAHQEEVKRIMAKVQVRPNQTGWSSPSPSQECGGVVASHLLFALTVEPVAAEAVPPRTVSGPSAISRSDRNERDAEIERATEKMQLDYDRQISGLETELQQKENAYAVVYNQRKVFKNMNQELQQAMMEQSRQYEGKLTALENFGLMSPMVSPRVPGDASPRQSPLRASTGSTGLIERAGSDLTPQKKAYMERINTLQNKLHIQQIKQAEVATSVQSERVSLQERYETRIAMLQTNMSKQQQEYEEKIAILQQELSLNLAEDVSPDHELVNLNHELQAENHEQTERIVALEMSLADLGGEHGRQQAIVKEFEAEAASLREELHARATKWKEEERKMESVHRQELQDMEM